MEKGFIRQFATVTDAKGNRVLNASHVGLWAAMNYVTQAVAQFASPMTAEKFGIRFNMYLFTLMKVVVSPLCLLRYPADGFDYHNRNLLHDMVAFSPC